MVQSGPKDTPLRLCTRLENLLTKDGFIPTTFLPDILRVTMDDIRRMKYQGVLKVRRVRLSRRCVEFAQLAHVRELAVKILSRSELCQGAKNESDLRV